MDRLKILLADDEPEITEIIGEFFENGFKNLGYECEILIVENGQDAMTHIDCNKFDLIVLDHYMPGIKGTDLLAYVRNPEVINHETPVIIFSGHINDTLDPETSKAERVLFIEKTSSISSFFTKAKIFIFEEYRKNQKIA